MAPIAVGGHVRVRLKTFRRLEITSLGWVGGEINVKGEWGYAHGCSIACSLTYSISVGLQLKKWWAVEPIRFLLRLIRVAWPKGEGTYRALRRMQTPHSPLPICLSRKRFSIWLQDPSLASI